MESETPTSLSLGSLRLRLESYAGSTLPEWGLFASNVRLTRLAMGQSLFGCGEEYPYVHIIQQGIIKATMPSDGPRPTTLFFAEEGDVVASLSTVSPDGARRLAKSGIGPWSEILFETINGRTTFAATAVESTQVFQITFKVLEHLANQHIAWARLLYTLTLLHVLRQRVEIAYLRMTPERRYRQILQDRPSLVNRITQRDLAGLLNVTEETLSRIAKRVRAEDSRHGASVRSLSPGSRPAKSVGH